MADKKIRTKSTDIDTLAKDPIAPIKETKQPKDKKPDQYDSILQVIKEQNEKIAIMAEQNVDQLAKNKILEEKIAAAGGDISEKVKKAKRKYGYNLDGTRKPDELFKYRYNCLIDDGKEKVVISTKTIGRPLNIRNDNTGKWTNVHNLDVEFQDGSKMKIDVLDYINHKFQYEDFVKDEDIEVKDGNKTYKFRTENFGTFTVPLDFIN